MLVYEYASQYHSDFIENSEFICGTEYEIEDVRNIRDPILGLFEYSLSEDLFWWSDLGFVKDNSLRNNGVEIVTKPVSYKKALDEFKRIHSIVQYGKDAFSSRTSIHVHVNVLPWSLDKVKYFTLLYVLFESYYFQHVGNRNNNINCVPLTNTFLPKIYKENPLTIIEHWSKYTAFNLLPVKTYGTIEFRHLYGTDDINVYDEWLLRIKALWDFVNKTIPILLEDALKKGESVNSIFYKVFNKTTDLNFSNSLIDVKMAF